MSLREISTGFPESGFVRTQGIASFTETTCHICSYLLFASDSAHLAHLEQMSDVVRCTWKLFGSGEILVVTEFKKDRKPPTDSEEMQIFSFCVGVSQQLVFVFIVIDC